MKSPKFSLRIRHYPDAPFVGLWLVLHDGAARSSVLYGQVLPEIAEAAAKALGVPVERDETPLPTLELPQAGGLPSVAKQRSLFGDAS